jgi:hypothetical protein
MLFCLTALFLGCIKDAPPNPEADIEKFELPDSLRTSNVFIDNANNKIMLYLTPAAYASGVAPVISVSKGGSVTPASGDSIHFDNLVQYVVTSESGANKRTYNVLVINVGNWTFNFEKWELNASDKYQYPVEDDNTELWSSGNPGAALSGLPQQPDAYPTKSTDQGYLNTKAAEMVTLKGTVLSQIVGVNLIAGSLFLGNFNTEAAFLNPLEATEFGEPYVGRPDRFTGYYKYSPGAAYQDENAVIQPSKKDSCSIYAVLFNGPTRLNGTNVNTSDKIVAKAKLVDGTPKTEFTRFDLPFEYLPGSVAGNNLMLAIVVSSSTQGDRYRGAVGSRLVVDSLRIIPQ